jgi:hypothetical protein
MWHVKNREITFGIFSFMWLQILNSILKHAKHRIRPFRSIGIVSLLVVYPDLVWVRLGWSVFGDDISGWIILRPTLLAFNILSLNWI